MDEGGFKHKSLESLERFERRVAATMFLSSILHENIVGHERISSKANGISAPGGLTKMKVITIKIIALTVFGLALGFAQAWASSRYYEPKHVAGFHMGLLHGMLMPAALPGLLMGNDLPIYAPNNSGRPYNIGYILGINFCGTVFFGVGFWQPRRR